MSLIKNVKMPIENNIITTPYEKVLSILNEVKNFISIISTNQTKLIRDINWVIKIINSHSLYTYELKDKEIIDKIKNENEEFKDFVKFVYEYNEDILKLNKKNFLINSKSQNIKKNMNLLNVPSIKFKKMIKNEKNAENEKKNEIQKINYKNNNNLKINKNQMTEENVNFDRNEFNNKLNLYSLKLVLKYNNSNINKNNMRKNSKHLKLFSPLKSSNYHIKNNLSNEAKIFETQKNSSNLLLNSIELPKIKHNILNKTNNDNNNNNNNKTDSNNNKNNHNNNNNNKTDNNNNKNNHNNKNNKTDNNNNKTDNNNINKHNSNNNLSFSLNQNDFTFSKSQNLSKSNHKLFSQINNLIKQNNFDPNSILNQNFDIFDLKKIIGYDNVLPFMGKQILENFFLFNDKIIPLDKLENLLYNISKSYNKNVLYHNAIHASDITQTLSLFFLNSNLEEKLETNILDLLSIFIAALGHDSGHPGFNNNFHINSLSDLAITYNDNSVLENFHCSKLFKILMIKENNIFENINKEDFRLIRKRIISEILSTDMAHHGKIMSIVKSKIIFNEKKSFNNSSKENDYLKLSINNYNNDNILLLSGNPSTKFEEQQSIFDFLIHSADIAHNVKPFHISLKWVELLSNEFWIQGDVEKQNNLPISFLCDRNDSNIPNSQIGFIKGFILPTFELLVQIFPSLDYTVKNANDNINKWQMLLEQNRRTGWTPRNVDNRNFGFNFIEYYKNKIENEKKEEHYKHIKTLHNF